jgi:hypothetical protein
MAVTCGLYAKEAMEDMFDFKHISVSINRSPSDVYAFISDGANLAQWASGLGNRIQRDGDQWLAQGPLGTCRVRLVKVNDLGVADHTVTTETGLTITNPIRVIPNGEGCTVTFTVMRLPDVSERQFNDDAAWVQKDLETLKTIMEKR